MGLLAYHPERLAHLRLTMKAASAELRATRCADPAADGAMAVVGAALAELDHTSLPLVARILDSPAMSRGQLHGAHLGDLENSLVRVMAGGYGWSVQVDPLDDDVTVVTAEEARALGAMLARADGRTLAQDRETLEWLATQLSAIAADPVLSREFLANFSDWAELADWLAWSHLLHSGGDPIQVDADLARVLDSVFAGLGRIAWHAVPAACVGSVAALVPDATAMNPYTVALLIERMPLDDVALASVTTELLRLYLDLPTSGSDGPWTDKDFDTGPNTADILFATLLDRPSAAAHFVRQAVGDPNLLLATAADQSLAHEVLLLGTDPAVVSSAEVAPVILHLLEALDGTGPTTIDTSLYGFDPAWHEFLGALVAPWLIEFGGVSTTWPASAPERARLLAFVTTDDAALDTLLARAETAVASIASSLQQGTASTVDVASTLGLLLQLFVGEEVRREEVRERQHQLVWGVAGLVVGSLGGTPGKLATAASRPLTAWTGAFGSPDPEDTRHDAELEMAWVLAVTAAAVTSATFHRLVDEGALNDDVPPPPSPDPASAHPDHDLLADFERWKLDNEITGTRVELILDGALLQFVNGAGAGEHLGESLG